MKIQQATTADYSALIAIWEASVRATHDFLPEDNIAELKPLILEHYFDAVELRCASIDGRLIGFIGVADNNIEMLFVHPEHFGAGVGRELVQYAQAHLAATHVDVNEQNPGAISFYEKMGFQRSGRSELDGQGNAFPLIHMSLMS